MDHGKTTLSKQWLPPPWFIHCVPEIWSEKSMKCSDTILNNQGGLPGQVDTVHRQEDGGDGEERWRRDKAVKGERGKAGKLKERKVGIVEDEEAL